MASRKNTIKTNIEANSEGFIKAMDEVQRSIKETRVAFNNINAVMKSTGDTTEALQDHKKLLQTEITNTKAKLDILNKGLKESIKINGEDSEATRIAREEVMKASTHYENLKNKLKEVNIRLEEQTFSLKNVSNAFGKVSEVTDKFANKVKWLSAGTGSLLGLGAKTAIDFEDAFVGVTKTVEGTDEQLNQIRADIMNLSKNIPIATTELFALAEEAGQLGIKTENVSQFTELMAKLATATNLSATEAGEAIATFVNIMGTLPENYERIGSTIVQLGNNSKATEADIVSMVMRMAGAGATLGMSEASLLGLATALSSVGLEAEMGGTAMSRIMNDFNRAASGVETKYGSLSQYAKICGMSTKEFADTVKNNAGEAIKQFIIGLGDTNRTGESTIKLMSALGINEVRLTDTMLRLANASSTVEEYMTMADQEWEINNALNIEASKRYADTASQVELTKNKFAELADKFGQVLLPSINNILDKIGRFTNWLVNLDQKTQEAIVNTLMFVTALFPVAKAISKITGTIESITGAIDKFKKGEGALFTISKGLSKLGGVIKTVGGIALTVLKTVGVAIMTHPVIAIIATIITSITLLWVKCEWFRNLITNMFEKIKKVCFSVWQVIKDVIINSWNNIINTIRLVLSTIINTVTSTWNKLVEITKPVFEIINKIISSLCEKIKILFEPIKSFFVNTWTYIVNSLKPVINSFFNMFNEGYLLIKTILDKLKGLWQGVISIFKTVISNITVSFIEAWQVIKKVWDLVVPFFETIWEGISATFNTVVEFFDSMFSIAWETIKFAWDLAIPYFELIWETIKSVFSAVAEVLGSFFTFAWDSIKLVWDNVVQYFQLIWAGISGVFSVVVTVIGGAFQVAWQVIKAIWDTVTGYFKAIFDTIANIFSVIRNVLTGHWSAAWEGIKEIVNTWADFFLGIWNSIALIFGQVVEFFKNIFSAAWEAIKGVFNPVGNFFKGVWNTIKSIFTGIAQTVGDAMSSVFRAAVNGLLSLAEKVLNTPINAINAAIKILNKVPGVDISLLKTFELPRMEQGGVLDKGARTIIAGENGAEAIVPLENNTKWINRVAEQLKASIMDLNTNYLYQENSNSYSEEYLVNMIDLLERILAKPSDTYIDGRKVSEATASTDDRASGDLLSKLERGWVT